MRIAQRNATKQNSYTKEEEEEDKKKKKTGTLEN